MDRASSPEKRFREIRLIAGEGYCKELATNRVRTGQYSFLTFVPMTIAEVLIQRSTFWFLAMIAIEWNPFELDYERTYGTTALFVMHTSLLLLKSALATLHFHRSDRSHNNKHCRIWSDESFIERRALDLRIGNCILISKGECVPGDALLLSTSSSSGRCHFSTQFPLGESDLTTKSAVPPTFRLLQKSASSPFYNMSRLSGMIRVMKPKSDFGAFAGTIKLPWLPRTTPLKVDNLVLRGSELKGEEWAIAVLVYIGMETKFWQGMRRAAVRAPFIDAYLNIWIVWCVCAVVICSVLHVLGQYLRSQQALTPGDFLQYVYMYQHVVPLPLYIALEVQRVLFAIRCRGGKEYARANPPAILSDLGRVEYVVADKTGTLTQNRLELVAVLLGAQMYTKVTIFPTNTALLTAHIDDNEVLGSYITGDSVASFEALRRKLKDNLDDELRRFCECVTLCNSVVIQKDNSMLATSADEEALMQGAKALGFDLISRGRDECDICYFDMCHSYKVWCVRKFNREAKRMRILVQQEIDDFATLYIKGSYHTLQNLLQLSPHDRELLEGRLKEMEQHGLRTMVLCYREISGDYLAEVQARAANAMSAKLNMDGKLEVLFQELEQQLTYLGVTGVMDYCAPDVKDAIQQLSKYEIKTWMMSGEGESHSLAAAYDIGLITPETEVVSLRGLSKSTDCQKRLVSAVHELLCYPVAESSALDIPRISIRLPSQIAPTNAIFALSIDGQSFTAAVRQVKTQRLLLVLLLTASSVCFYSLSPWQKKAVVRLMKQGIQSPPLILCVGDGANDLPMLLEANVKVGFVQSSVRHSCDFSVLSFARMVRLMLCEGRMSAFLESRMVAHFLYSQTLYGLVATTFVYFADFTPYAPITLDAKLLFGSIFTFCPLLLVGVIGLQATDKNSESRRREITKRKGAFMDTKTLIQYALLALCHYAALLVFLYPASHVGQATEVSSSEQGFLYLFASVCIVNLHCALEVRRVSIVFIAAGVLSTGAALAYFAVLGEGLVEVFSTPHLLLGLVGAVLGGLAMSIGKWQICALWDRKPLRATQRILPLNGTGVRLTPIQKTRETLMNHYSQQSFAAASQPSKLALVKRATTLDTPEFETEYQRAFIAENYWMLVCLLLIALAQAIVPLAFEVGEDGREKVDLGYKSAAVGMVLGMLVVYSVQGAVLPFSWTLGVVVLVVCFILNIVLDVVNEFIYFYVTVCMLLFLQEKMVVIFPITIAATVLMITATLVHTRNEELTNEIIVNKAGVILAQVLTHILAGTIGWRKAVQRRVMFKELKTCEETALHNENILACLLPEFVRKQVKDGIRYIAEDKGEVSVIFIDIHHFAQICALYAPQELTALLDDIFQKIDEMCASLHVAKIETVGKTYLACAGLRDYEFEEAGEYIKIPHAKRCLDLAFAVLSSFRNYKLQSGLSLEFKIGINTGEVIAGVVGFHKPQFSLVGDTVNTASRMCSTLEHPNSVQISESAYFVVKQFKQFQFARKQLAVKGKGEMTTYIVTQTSLDKGSPSPQHFSDDIEESDIIHLRSSLTRGATRASTITSEFDRFPFPRVAVNISFWRRSEEEDEFLAWLHAQDLRTIRLGLILYTIGMCAVLASRVILKVLDDTDFQFTIPVYVCLTVAGVVCSACISRLLTTRWYPWLIITLFSITVVSMCVDSEMLDGLPARYVDLIIGFMLVLLYHSSGILFKHMIPGLFLVVLPHTLIWTDFEQYMAEENVFYFLFGVQNCIVMYFTERNRQTHFYMSKHVEREIQKTEQLLTQMMPAHAFEGLKSDQWMTDLLTSVSILYADIAGFTAWSSEHLPQEVIGKLSKIFTEFDKICVKKQMYKVHTIGDCYVALSSTNNSDKRDFAEECASMVSFALEMASVVEKTCDEDHEHLKMRIGVHVGDVTAGITGSGVVRYDIYGPDVLVANKMESSGREGRVNISAEAKRMLEQREKDEYLFEFNKNVEVQEIGRSTDCFFVSYQS